MAARVLLVEDDESIGRVTTLLLQGAGLEVTHVVDGRAALDAARSRPFDIVVLDLMLPEVDGYQVCERLRADSRVPILILTARDSPAEVVAGLELGADDYVAKPFDPAELLARVRALLRRARPDTGAGAHRVRDVEIDPVAYRVRKRGVEIDLSPTEFRLLQHLAANAGQVLTREVLLDRVWGYDYLGSSRLVDMAVKRLRDKVEDDPGDPRLIVTVRGVGYRLEPGDEGEGHAPAPPG